MWQHGLMRYGRENTLWKCWNYRVGIVIEHLFLFFIRFHTVPMATDEDVSEPSHLQAA